MKQKKPNLIEKINLELNENSKVESFNITISKRIITIFYIESLIDKQLVSGSILQPLQKFSKSTEENPKNKLNIDVLIQKVFPVTSIEKATDSKEIISSILDGKVVVILDDQGMIIPVFGAEKRSVQEPPTSRVVKGPREGFVEDVSTNIGLIRKNIIEENIQKIIND